MRGATTKQGQRMIGRDPHQPRGKAGLTAKPVEVLQHTQECLLDDFLGILPLPDDPHRQTIDTPLVFPQEHLERGVVTGLGSFNRS